MAVRCLFALVLIALAACSAPATPPPDLPAPTAAITKIAVVVTPAPVFTPTPFSIIVYDRYTVRSGDTLGAISARYDLTLEELMKLNGITNPNAIQIGQQLKIPAQVTRAAPADKILPDSEIVYSPAYATFDVSAFANQAGGYLATYREKVEGETLTGAQIVQLVAERYSVGPRALLALLEYETGWVTQTALTPDQVTYAMGLRDAARQTFFYQVSWAANRLNEGYYGKLSGRLAAFRFKDRTRARVAPNANPGTVAIQNFLAQLNTWDAWQTQIGNDGFLATYRKLFGDPSQSAIEPLIPADLKQPMLRLPWNNGEMWYYTGGPHGGWNDGSGWAAIDFSPKDVLGSCLASRLWTTAAASGKVIRAEHGRVVVSLGNNDFPGTGWALMYLHIATKDRATPGALVNVGDRIGHPSCEGGTSESSHVHFARLYNGQWIEPNLAPFVLSGWQVTQVDQEYEGKLTRSNEAREACNCREDPKNGIVADAGK